jgi:hypothetical protein
MKAHSHFRTLAAACALALTVSAGVASGASAASVITEVAPSYLSGTQKATTVIGVNAGKIECKSTTFTGVQLEKTASSLQLDPTFGECTAFGAAAKAKASGIHIASTNITRTFFFFGHSEQNDLVDTNGSQLQIVVGSCEITIGEQKPAGLTEFEEQGSGASRALLVSHELSGISYTSTGGICGKSGTNGTLNTSVLLKGYQNEAHTEQVGLWIE